MRKVVITAASRTAIAAYGGGLSSVHPSELGATVMKDVIEKSKIKASDIDEVLFGCVLQAGLGQNISRQCAIKAGIPVEVPTMTINKVCGSGLRTVSLAAQLIRLGDADVIVAGGTENMSMAPYVVPKMRFGARMGNAEMIDEMVYTGLTEVFNNYHMGITAENLVEKFNISREEQDQFAQNSQEKAIAAVNANKFADEIAPVTFTKRRKEVTIDKDEHINFDSTIEGLAKLRPAFKRDGGSVTAGNASGINDGAAAVLVMSEEKAKELGAPILAEIVDYGSGGVDPAIMGYGPVPAIKKALDRAKMKLDEIELFELNEAFAAQSIAVVKGLEQEGIGKVDMDKINVNGGAIALGHPIGASGCRILVTLLHEMKKRGSKTGLASLCIGGGMGTTLIVKM